MSGGATPNRPGFLGVLRGVYVANTISRLSPPGPVRPSIFVGGLCGGACPPLVLRILTRLSHCSTSPFRYRSGFFSFRLTDFALLVLPVRNFITIFILHPREAESGRKRLHLAARPRGGIAEPNRMHLTCDERVWLTCQLAAPHFQHRAYRPVPRPRPWQFTSG